jgi:hypothetical protein
MIARMGQLENVSILHHAWSVSLHQTGSATRVKPTAH